MKTIPIAALVLAALATAPIKAQTTKPNGTMASISFLIGTWQNGAGTVADTGQTSAGTSTFSNEVGGAAMIRRDHTDLFDKAGKPAGSFDQLMMVYADGPRLRADYTDGTHVIHYVNATVDANRSVEFDTAAPSGAPNFRLTYALIDPGTLSVKFEIEPPGATQFHPIATGSLTRGSN